MYRKSEIFGEYVSPTQAARRLGMSHTTILDWCREGILESIKLPSGRFIVLAETIESLANLKEGGDNV